METKIKELITQLKQENEKRGFDLSDENISQYMHSALVHNYNLTLEFIERLEKLVKKQL